MKLIAITFVLLLAGCTTVVPVKQHWPEPPGLQSQKTCPQLKKLPEGVTLSEVSKIVSDNYTEYYKCLVKLEAWQEWYKKQEMIHKELK